MGAVTDAASMTERAIALIRQHGTLRSDQIEQALGIRSASALLSTAVLRGDLVCCLVERPGKRAVNEYRIAASAGGTAPVAFRPLGAQPNPPKHRAAREVEARRAPAPAAGAKFVGEIEHAVPIPPSKRGDGSLRARLASLQPGDSFVTSYSATGCYSMAKTLGIKITYRPQGEGRIRVWRIA